MKKDIIGKVKKLLSLATSDNEEEAGSAYSKAMGLMIKHNIDFIKSGSEKEYESSKRYSRIESQEIKYVNEILMKCFFVVITRRRVFIEEGEWRHKTEYKYYGEKTNLDIAMYAFDFLVIEFKRLWREYRKGKKIGRSGKQSYYMGLGMGFLGMFEEKKNYAENKFAVTISEKDDGLREYIRQVAGKTGVHKPKTRVGSVNALSDGILAGEKIKINRAVSSKVDNVLYLK